MASLCELVERLDGFVELLGFNPGWSRFVGSGGKNVVAHLAEGNALLLLALLEACRHGERRGVEPRLGLRLSKGSRPHVGESGEEGFNFPRVGVAWIGTDASPFIR